MATIGLWDFHNNNRWQNLAESVAASAASDPIAVVKDSSGNGNDLVNTGGTDRPTVLVADINGLDAASFDGSNDFLGITSSFISASVDAFCIYLVARWRAAPSGVSIHLGDGDGTGSGTYGLMQISSSRHRGYINQPAPLDADNLGAGVLVPDTAYHLFTLYWSKARASAFFYDAGLMVGRTGGNFYPAMWGPPRCSASMAMDRFYLGAFSPSANRANIDVAYAKVVEGDDWDNLGQTMESLLTTYGLTRADEMVN